MTTQTVTNRDTARTGAILTAIGAGAVMLGSLLPWVSAQTLLGSLSVSGTSGDGIFTLILGAVVGLGAVAHLTGSLRWRKWTLGLAYLTIAVAVGAAISLIVRMEPQFVIGAGVYVVIAGAALAVYGADRARR